MSISAEMPPHAQMSLAQQLLFQVRSTGRQMMMRLGFAQSSAAKLMQRLQPLDAEVARWATLSAPNAVYAYCFCAVE